MSLAKLSWKATLRTYIQRCTNANFIFSGSHRHLMGERFTSPARPFYQSVTIFNLKPIPLDKYKEFATEKFELAGKHLADGVVENLYERFNSITSYMQKVMNYMYQLTLKGETCTQPMIDDAINYILDISSDTYEGMLYQMPEMQWYRLPRDCWRKTLSRKTKMYIRYTTSSSNYGWRGRYSRG